MRHYKLKVCKNSPPALHKTMKKKRNVKQNLRKNLVFEFVESST